MEELDKIVQRMIDAGESEENIKIVIENYKPEETVETGAAKTEAVATETAPVTAENPAASTDSASVDGSLESQPMDPFLVNGEPVTEEEFNKVKSGNEEEMGYLGKLWTDIKKGSSSLGEMMASVPETIYNIFAIPQNAISELTGIESLSTSSKKFKKRYDIENPILDFYEKESKELGKVQDIYNNKNYEYQGIYNNFKKGNYIDGFKQLGSGIAESAPVSISMMVGGAAASTGKLAAASTVAMGGPEISKQLDNESQSELAGVIKGLGLAGAESVFSSIGTGTLGRVYKDIILKEGKEAGVKVFRNGLVEMYSTALKKVGAPISMFGEGVEEVATTITQNMINGVNAFDNVADSFIQGVGGGGFYGAPINVAQAQKAVSDGITNVKINRDLKGSDFTSVVEPFTFSDSNDLQLQILKNKGAFELINNKVDKEVIGGRISKEKGDEIKINARNTQESFNTIEKTDIASSDKVKAVNLLKEKRNNEYKIKSVGDASLTQAESDRVKVISEELNSLVQKGVLENASAKLSKNIESVEKVSKKIKGVSVKSLDNAEAIDSFVKDNDLDIDKKASENQGFIYQDPKTGEQVIVINKEVAKKEQAVNVAGHEFLHGLLFQTVKNSPETQISLGKSLNEYINKIDTKQVKDSDFVKRLENYKDMDEATQSEEVLTLFSDAIVTGDIQFNEGVFTKIGDVIRRTLQNLGVNIKFNNGKDVYNFVKDYNKSIEKGSLTKAQKTVAVKGAKGTLVSEKVEASEAGIKESRQLTSDQDKLVASEVIDLQVIKKENKELAAKYNKEPIKGAKEVRLENKVLETLDPIIGRVVTDRTKALYDPIVDDAKKTVSRKDFQESMRSDIQAMIFEEFNGKQDIEKFIVNRAFLRANNLAKRLGIQSVEEGITKGLEAAEKIAIDETVATVDKDVKLTKATKILSSDQLNRAKESIAKMDIDPSQISYKKLGNVTADITAELVGIPAEKIISKTKNLSKSETTTAAMFIEKNVDYIRRTLPEGAVLEAATEKLIGTSTGVPKAMLNAFYAKGKRLSKGAGLIPWNKNKGITNNDILEAIGRPKGEKPSPIDPRSPKGQMIKGIISIVDKNITNELVRTEKDLTIEQEVDAGAGRSVLMFSKSTGLPDKINQFIENQDFVKTNDELAADNKVWKYIAKQLDIKPLSSKDANDVKEYRDWISTIALKLPREFFTQGTFANAGISAADRNFYFTSKADLNSVLDNLTFAETDADITEAVSRKTYVTGGANGKVSANFIKEFYTKAFKKKQQSKLNGLKKIFKVFEASIKENPDNARFIIAMLSSTSQGMGHFIRVSAPVKFYAKDVSSGIVEEHTMPASLVAKYLFSSAVNQSINKDFGNIEKNYFQGALPKADDKKLKGTKQDGKPFNYTAMTPEGWKISDNIWARYFNVNVGSNNGGIDPSNIIINNGKTIQEEFNINEMGFKVSPEFIKSKVKASKTNNNALPSSIKYSKDITIQEGIDALAKTDKALDNARKLDAPVKKIRVFDFDDTLAQTKSNVLYTMPDGTKGKIDAATFAKEAGNMEAEGAIWDFSEFSKVMQGTKGPLLEVAKIIADKRGTDDVFVLTARPANAAGPIKEFLASMGLDIPVSNIIGLGDGDPQAKAGWIMGKAAEGYNDFYFADDHTGNVKAVKDVLSQIDVKSKVQLAKVKLSKTLDLDFNKIIENKTGIASEKIYARVKAEVVGASKGKFDFFIPPSAEDFVGLLYKTLGKGKIGDAQMAWYKKHLLDPYARAMESVTRDKNTLGANFKALKKELGIIPRNLKKKITGEAFTKEQAVRVYIWNQTGQDVPGLSKSDKKDLVDYIKSNSELELFAQEIMKLGKGSGYIKASDSWVTGTITTDLMEVLNTTRRKQYLEQWQQNTDVIFSKENMNKLEAAYGKSYRESLEGTLKRMKIGRNRTQGMDGLTGRFVDWTTSATGAIMFFNTRSAVLQTLSAVNFINFGDNNIIAAGKAFANQPQYWSDFKMLFNSDFLVERRDGLKMNVNEADIADIAKERGVRGVVNKLLKLGFTPTQIADSFAIAAGGSTFYRNRVKSLVKNGMDTVAAEKQAMRDFRETAEESQQSSRPDKISQQQAGPLGRVILAFANTPAQYARIMKKAASDIKNGRGDLKTNVSKIIYYSIAQNLLFNALQSAILATMFGEDEEEDPKTVRIANGMLDSILRGIGVGGAIVSVIKNAGIKWVKESDKKRADYTKVVDELLKISPPISSKIGKLKNATRSYSWDKKEMMEGGFGLDNPAYLAIGNVVSATTNIPMDRVVKKINNLKAASDSELEAIMRIHLLAGWSEWELGVDSKKKPKKKPKNKRYNYIKSKITYK